MAYVAKTSVSKARQRLLDFLASRGMSVSHSRRQRNGVVSVYLFEYYGDDRVVQVDWNPRNPGVVGLYKQVWVQTNCRNLGGHQEDVRVGLLALPDDLAQALSEDAR